MCRLLAWRQWVHRLAASCERGLYVWGLHVRASLASARCGWPMLTSFSALALPGALGAAAGVSHSHLSLFSVTTTSACEHGLMALRVATAGGLTWLSWPVSRFVVIGCRTDTVLLALSARVAGEGGTLHPLWATKASVTAVAVCQGRSAARYETCVFTEMQTWLQSRAEKHQRASGIQRVVVVH